MISKTAPQGSNLKSLKKMIEEKYDRQISMFQDEIRDLEELIEDYSSEYSRRLCSIENYKE